MMDKGELWITLDNTSVCAMYGATNRLGKVSTRHTDHSETHIIDISL